MIILNFEGMQTLLQHLLHNEMRVIYKTILRDQKETELMMLNHSVAAIVKRRLNKPNNWWYTKEHTQVKKPSSCSNCDYKASVQNYLNLHERIHTGDKPFSRLRCQKYPCSHCGKMFTQSGARQIHERIHTGERPFKCSVCDYKCMSSSNLRKHMKKH